MQTQAQGPNELPSNDNINPYAFCVDLQGEFFLQKGKMIAYYGDMRFELLTHGPLQSLIAGHFTSPLYANDFMVATGRGKLILGDRGFDINSYDLEDGNLTVRASSLLGFESTLTLKQSIIPGFLTLLGTGKFLASSNGAVIFAEPPMRVDPQALVGWADCPTPYHHYDHGVIQGALGMATMAFGLRGQSGEEHQFEFSGSGTIILQSSEAVQDAGMLREMEGQVPMLGLGGLQRMQSVINQRLAAEQQSSY